MSKHIVIALTVLAVAAGAPALASHEVQFTGFPDMDATSGKFVNITRGLKSLGEEKARFALEVPGHLPTIELLIFDGDGIGTWDPYTGDQTVFSLYADPDRLGNLEAGNLIAQWSCNELQAYDNAWFPISLPQDPAALAADGNYFYNLVAEFTTFTKKDLMNNFKIAIKGQVFGLKESRYGFIGFGPAAFLPTFPPTTYDGTWEFDYIATEAKNFIEFWNGDFDFAGDSNDPNSPSFPPFPYTSSTLAQGARAGIPSDPAVNFTVTPPDGSWTAHDVNPSGNQEWEVFRIGLFASDNLDVFVPTLPLGRYDWRILNVAAGNTLFIHATRNLHSGGFPGAIGDFVWNDANGDGLQNDGPGSGIGGVSVALWYDSDENGVVDFLKASATTAADGFYLFEDLPPGTYEVHIDPASLPADMVQTFDYDDGTGPFATHHSARVVLGVAELSHDVDFGYRVPPPSGGQGCTPGYWRQTKHFNNWTGYRPDQWYNQVFSVPYVKTLLQAVTAGGGGATALGRHAVAALLNAANPQVDYLFTKDQIIAMVQEAYATGQFEAIKDILEEQNEMGCPL